jgi:hypothetical protein
MYTVEYGYYNYPRKTKAFDTYAEAKAFFWRLMGQKGVRRIELITA